MSDPELIRAVDGVANAIGALSVTLGFMFLGFVLIWRSNQ